MSPEHFLILIHPAVTVILVFPLIGIAVNLAWQTRQRRLQIQEGAKSKIPAVVGREHVSIGNWLAGTVVGITLLGLAYPLILGKGGLIAKFQRGNLETFPAIFISLMFIATIVSLVLLYRSRQKHWRGIFATLTGMGIIILGSQPGVYRRTDEWYWSHYYYGIVAALLMIFSVAIVEDIYQDRSQRWRYVHIILNCLALLLFIGQGFTGTRDLFEIGLYLQPVS